MLSDIYLIILFTALRGMAAAYLLLKIIRYYFTDGSTFIIFVPQLLAKIGIEPRIFLVCSTQNSI
jgi:hypothetical protein